MSTQTGKMAKVVESIRRLQELEARKAVLLHKLEMSYLMLALWPEAFNAAGKPNTGAASTGIVSAETHTGINRYAWDTQMKKHKRDYTKFTGFMFRITRSSDGEQRLFPMSEVPAELLAYTVSNQGLDE